MRAKDDLMGDFSNISTYKFKLVMFMALKYLTFITLLFGLEPIALSQQTVHPYPMVRIDNLEPGQYISLRSKKLNVANISNACIVDYEVELNERTLQFDGNELTPEVLTEIAKNNLPEFYITATISTDGHYFTVIEKFRYTDKFILPEIRFRL